MYVVIEIEDDTLSDAMVRRQLADVQRRIEKDDWRIELDTPVRYYYVSRVAGVAHATDMAAPGGQVLAVVVPLEGSERVEL